MQHIANYYGNNVNKIMNNHNHNIASTYESLTIQLQVLFSCWAQSAAICN